MGNKFSKNIIIYKKGHIIEIKMYKKNNKNRMSKEIWVKKSKLLNYRTAGRKRIGKVLKEFSVRR